MREQKEQLLVSGTLLAAFMVVDAVSYLSYFFPFLSLPLIVLTAGAVGWFALRNFSMAVLIAVAELMVGSHGYLWSAEVGGFVISARLAIFLPLLGGALVKVFQCNPDERRTLLRPMIWFLPLAVALAIGVARGVLRRYGLAPVFFDANGYFYFAMLLPLLVAAREATFRRRVTALLISAAAYLTVKTLFLLYLFTHDSFQFVVIDLYHWLRDYRLGEITATATGAYRIFLPSQLYLLAAWWVVAGEGREQPMWRMGRTVVLLSALSAGLLVSFSRSFWLGWIGSVAVVVVWLGLRGRPSEAFRQVVLFFVAVLVALAVILAIVRFPLPQAKSSIRLGFSERLEFLGEPAASSRWNSLVPLWQGIREYPLLGSGFGRTVTYTSDDPRVRATAPDGTYVTYAFEWGYLDQWLKLGVVGLLAYGLMVVRIIWLMLKRDHVLGQSMGWAGAFLALLITHIGSPYLNHPLGIGLLLLLFAIESMSQQFESSM